ncbi:MAG: DUF262 domain-containing protein [Brevinema sp.]
MIKKVSNPVLIDLLKQNAKDVRFIIPEYQRNYSWGDEEIGEFISDIIEAYDRFKEDNNYSYFFGSIITESLNNNASPYEEYNLIDGQQRITTFLLFLRILYDALHQELSKFPSKMFDSTNQDVWGDLRRVIWMNGNDQGQECKLISRKKEDILKLSDVLNNPSKLTDQNQFSKNYSSLKKHFDAQNISDLESLKEFIKFILSKIVLVQVDTISRESALKIFSILNTRGLELTASDIIKAEAMEYISEDKYSYFSDKWANITKIADSLDTNMDTLFRYYINIYFPKSVKGTIDENIKSIWHGKEYFDKDIFRALESLQDFLHSYRSILSIKDPYILCLRYLLKLGRNAYTWIPVLTAMKYKNYSDHEIVTVAKFLVKWHWLHLLNGWTIEKMKTFNFSLIELIMAKQDVSEILKKKPLIVLDDITEKFLKDKIKEALLTLEIYHQKWCKPLLFFISDITLKDLDNAIIEQQLRGKRTVEHIFPQTPDQAKWIGCSREKTDVLGNLTMLSKIENSSAGNTLESKMKIYQSSTYAWTPELSQTDPWDDQKIDQRSRELIDIFLHAI